MKKDNLINVIPAIGYIYCSAETINKIEDLKNNIFGDVTGVVDISEGGILIPEGTKGYLKKDNGNIPLRVIAVNAESKYEVNDYIYLSQLNVIEKVVEGVACLLVGEFDIAGKVANIEKYQDYIDTFTLLAKDKIARSGSNLTIANKPPLVNVTGFPIN